jgi:hypothetical protein
MKKLFGLAFAVSLVLVPSLAASAMTMEEAGEKFMGLIESVATIVDSDKDNCDKMATDLTKYEDDNAALLKELNEMKGKRTDADRKSWQDKYKDRFKAAQQKMLAGGEKCQKNEKVKAAFGKLK